MSLDAAIAQARELFDGLGNVSHRKMFGGAGLYCDGLIFALIVDEEIMLKATGGFAEELNAQGAHPFTYARGKHKPTQMPYWSLPDSALDDPDEAVELARRALECFRAAKK